MWDCHSQSETTPADKLRDVLLGARVSLTWELRHSCAKDVDNGRQTESEDLEEWLNGDLEQHIGCKVGRSRWLQIASGRDSRWTTGG